MNFYLSQNGQQLGPYSMEQIRLLLQQGLATTTDRVWAEGWPDWMPIGNVPGMVEETATATPPMAQALPPIPDARTANPDGLNVLCVLMHLSQFIAFISLFAGYLIPFLMWQRNKRFHPMLDKQGRIIANWIISSLIYDVVVILLCFLLVGFLIGPVLFAIELIFPIIGALKASKGEAWVYPLSIPFFKV